jgi:hypothetical protein
MYLLMVFIILFILQEGKPLLNTKAYKELAVAGIIMLLALAYGIDYIMGSQLLPNPDLLLTLLKPLSQSFEKFFQVNG